MNLAIHDIPMFRGLVFRGATVSFAQRGIVPWITPDVLRNWSGLDDYVQSGLLSIYEIGDGDRAFYETFHRGCNRPLAARESKMLFLAELSGSVVMAKETITVQSAKRQDLLVWSGEMHDLDQFFPIRYQEPPSPAGPEISPTPPLFKRTITFSTEFPTDRQVPDRKESIRDPRDKARAGRRGKLSTMPVHAA